MIVGNPWVHTSLTNVPVLRFSNLFVDTGAPKVLPEPARIALDHFIFGGVFPRAGLAITGGFAAIFHTSDTRTNFLKKLLGYVTNSV